MTCYWRWGKRVGYCLLTDGPQISFNMDLWWGEYCFCMDLRHQYWLRWSQGEYYCLWLIKNIIVWQVAKNVTVYWQVAKPFIVYWHMASLFDYLLTEVANMLIVYSGWRNNVLPTDRRAKMLLSTDGQPPPPPTLPVSPDRMIKQDRDWHHFSFIYELTRSTC